jgi:hypothetical protein
MTVLVGSKDGLVYNIDPYIGYDWRYPGTDEMMPFGEVLGHIKHGRYQEVAMQEVPLPRPAITEPNEKPNRFNWLFPEGIPEPVKYDDCWVYQGATPSWDRLFALGAKNRLRADKHRGDQPLDEWLLDLMLVGPQLGRFSSEYGSSNEFACMRELFYAMVEA